nr:integrase core domain-containing protein [Phycicoccus mangrovi]
MWPADAPRGAVTSFCAEHRISRKTFYAILARARAEGQAAALEPRSRRPRSSPNQSTEDVKQQALGVRTALESSGLDYGPISVHDKMLALGMMPVPSVATLARIFREKGVARLEPKKKPRSAWRRFVYPAPNACWQLDATEYVLSGGRKCVIFQLIDDHSRLAIASHVALGETSEAAIAVVNKGIAAHGVPQRLLSDNGNALNPSRRGALGRLVTHLKALGVEPITGKPYKPTTQGKNERFHQTLFRWLDKQPLAGTLRELQAQVEKFDYIYNTQRPHQGLPGRTTPQEAWDATPVAEPPISAPGALRTISTRRPTPKPTAPSTPPPARRALRQQVPVAEALRTTTVRRDGTVRARHTEFLIGRRYAGQPAYVLYHATTLEFFDQHGTYIAEADWPDPAIKYVSADKLRPNLMAPESSVEGSTVTDVLTHGGTVTDVLRHESIVTDLPRHPPSPES